MSSNSFLSLRRSIPIFLGLGCFQAACNAQANPDLAEQVRQLTAAVNRVETQIRESQRQLNEMREQLAHLLARLDAAKEPNPTQTPEAAAKLQAQIDELRKQQGVQESQVAVQEQAKV